MSIYKKLTFTLIRGLVGVEYQLCLRILIYMTFFFNGIERIMNTIWDSDVNPKYVVPNFWFWLLTVTFKLYGSGAPSWYHLPLAALGCIEMYIYVYLLIVNIAEFVMYSENSFVVEN